MSTDFENGHPVMTILKKKTFWKNMKVKVIALATSPHNIAVWGWGFPAGQWWGRYSQKWGFPCPHQGSWNPTTATHSSFNVNDLVTQTDSPVHSIQLETAQHMQRGSRNKSVGFIHVGCNTCWNVNRTPLHIHYCTELHPCWEDLKSNILNHGNGVYAHVAWT